jgi:hypothetical protein
VGRLRRRLAIGESGGGLVRGCAFWSISCALCCCRLSVWIYGRLYAGVRLCECRTRERSAPRAYVKSQVREQRTHHVPEGFGCCVYDTVLGGVLVRLRRF